MKKLNDEKNKFQVIRSIIKKEQEHELESNLAQFKLLNQSEKTLREDLVDRQKQLHRKEKQLKREQVVHRTKIGKLRQEERHKFIGSFAQAKNLIENQLKVGFHLKQQKRHVQENKKKADAIR